MDKQILDYTDEEYIDLVKKIVADGSTVLHDQNLTRQELAKVCARMGKVEELDYFMNPRTAHRFLLCLVRLLMVRLSGCSVLLS